MRSTMFAVLAAGLALAVTACGHGAPAPPAPPPVTTSPATTEAAPRLRVGLVAGWGGGTTLAFRRLAVSGLGRAKRELGIESRVVVARGTVDAARGLAALARGDYDLVLALGTGPVTALDAVAARFPHVRFAVVNASRRSLPSRPRNVTGLLFAEQQAGYLAGYLAALVVRDVTGPKAAVGSVGGRPTPGVDRYLAGFQAGARAADATIGILNAYAGGFADPARCKELALKEIAQGAGAIFPVAGACGGGALEAARERSVWAIGVDYDASPSGGQILTSAVKRVDVVVFLAVEAARDRHFPSAEDIVFGVASGGVGLGAVSPEVPPEILARVNRIQDRIAAGRIASIPETLSHG